MRRERAKLAKGLRTQKKIVVMAKMITNSNDSINDLTAIEQVLKFRTKFIP